MHRARLEFSDAVDAYQHACDDLGESGDQHSEARAYGHLGDALTAAGRHDQAAAAYARSTELHNEVDELSGAERARVEAGASAPLSAPPQP